MKRTNERTNERADVVPTSRFRVERSGFVIHVESAEDVQQLLALFDTQISVDMRVRLPRSPRTKGRAATAVRGRSSGAIEGRVLSVLKEQGPLGPGALTTECKASRYHVTKAVRELVKRGAVLSQGSTSNRTFALKGARVVPLTKAANG